jgi:hypothetical protein
MEIMLFCRADGRWEINWTNTGWIPFDPFVPTFS